MEGTLFVVKRSAFPKFRVMVLNRVGLDNMELDINPGFTFELSLPYIMYKEGDDGVKGLWFYDQEEAALVAALLRKIADTLDAAAAKQQAARASKQAARRAQAQAQGASAARAAQAVASAAQGRRTAAESASGHLSSRNLLRWMPAPVMSHLSNGTSQAGRVLRTNSEPAH